MAELTAVPTQLLTDIADKIREKRDITESIPVPDMAMQIGLIEGGASLPPFIHNITGGTFSLDNMGDVVINADDTLQINYDIGDYPKLIAIWDNNFKTNETSGAFDVPNALIRFVMYLNSPTAPVATVRYLSGVLTYSNASSAIGNTNNATYSNKTELTRDYIKLACGQYIHPGRTYEWIAFN